MIPSLTAQQADLLGGALAFVFTVALLSYLIGDNPLYRLALHIFIGVSVGYATLIVIYQVLVPRLAAPLLSGDLLLMALAAVPLILFIFLIFKLSPRTASWGNVSIAFMLGVGVAVAVGGAIRGTLLPQVQATWLSLFPAGIGRMISNLVILIGTLATLLSFQFWLQREGPEGEPARSPAMAIVARIGQGFIVVTLGTVYGGMILSGLAVLGERLSALAGWLATVIR